MTRPKEERPEKQVAVWLKSEIKAGLVAAAAAEKRPQKAILEDALVAYLTKPAAPGTPESKE